VLQVQIDTEQAIGMMDDVVAIRATGEKSLEEEFKCSGKR
jgi:hypothetical protein